MRVMTKCLSHFLGQNTAYTENPAATLVTDGRTEMTYSTHRWRRGVAVTSLGESTKLLYVGPG